MTDEQHVRTDEYVDARRRRQARASLLLRVHRHLLKVCPECAEEWSLLAADQPRILDLILQIAENPEEPGEPTDDHLSCYSDEVRREERDLRRVRKIRQLGRVESWHLQDTPADARADKVVEAHVRFRSRAVAEYLLVRAREVVRTQPSDAESLASLVPLVLHWTPGAERASWAHDLHALSRAWVANARRVAGDLPGADKAWAQLRGDVARQPISSPSTLAELRSLEASLRIGQRRLAHAVDLLDESGLLFRRSGDRKGEVRVSVQQGNLFLELGRAKDAAGCFERAMISLDRAPADSSLVCAAVTGLVLSLCDMNLYDQARHLLDQHVEEFEAVDDLHAGAVVRNLEARIARGLGDLDAAEQGFIACREGYLAAGRHHDAALVCLDLAELYIASQQTPSLRRLLAEILPILQAQQVSREVLVVLQMLASSISRDEVSAELVLSLRRRLGRSLA